MIISDGGGRAVYTAQTPVVNVAPAPVVPYFEPRKLVENNAVRSIDELIAEYTKGKNIAYLRSDPIYQNMEYIREHPPQTKAEKEATTNELLNGILDAIGYASTIATFIPFPPLQIGGMFGYTATNAARAFSRGNTRVGLSNLNQMSRNLYRMRRQYSRYGQEGRYYG